MADKTKELKFKIVVNTTPAEAYVAFTNATALTEWLCDTAKADPRPGGRLYLGWNSDYYASGEFLTLEPGEKVVFSWLGRDEPGATRARVTFKPEEGGGTRITLTHSDFGSGKAWKPVIKGAEEGWVHGLENLKSVLETGQDLRVVRRPMLGVVGVEDLCAEDAEKLNLPVKGGLRLQGIVDGTGAQAAGLQKGDIIVKIAGEKTLSVLDFVNVMQRRQAGDQVKVVYYRQDSATGELQKQNVMMELSQRPIPAIPLTAAELAEVLKKTYAECFAGLQAALCNADKEQLNRRPAEGEWSAAEVMAHLIITERETQTLIGGLLEDRAESFEYHANQPIRVVATAATFHTARRLLAELKRLQLGTVALVAALPEEFVARKRSYWTMAYTLLTMPYHLEDHGSQIRAVLEFP